MKIALIGLGKVGTNAAFMLTQMDFVEELIIINRSKDKAQGIALDLFHCSPQLSTNVWGTDFGELEKAKGCDLIIVTAGVQRVEGQSRTDVAIQNKSILTDIFRKIKDPESKTIYLIATNPVDSFTYLAWQELGVSSKRVFGLGTSIDTMRFKAYLAKDLRVHPSKVNALILGEHGEKMVFIDQLPTVEDMEVSIEAKEEAFRAARAGGGELIKLIKGTHFGASLCLSKIIEAIYKDTGEILPLVTIYNYPNVGRVGLSLPVTISLDGIKQVIIPEMSSDEKKALDEAAASLYTRQNELLG